MKFCLKCGKVYADDAVVCLDDGARLAGRTGPDIPLGGTFAGRYQIVEKIGQGGMGAVYKAIHTRMNRVCAIKILAAEQAEGEAAVERFNREAQLASRIDNPHAVVIYDFGETEDGILFLVMEYVEGESLGQALLRERTFAPRRVCGIASQIAEALGAAHALGIVHRDLKPDNVMLTSRASADYVKVLDFGIAKTVSQNPSEDLTQTGFILGTPAYMSPEQLSGEKLDARSDIYSLALIVYQMLSGKLPFEGENTQARLIKRLIDSPVPLRTNAPLVSAEIDAAVMAGLARDRDHRPSSAGLFAESLRTCIEPRSADDATRSTGPVTGLPDTRVTASNLAGPTLAQSGGTASHSGPTSADSLPTVRIGAPATNTPAANTEETEAQGLQSPSAYITQQSTTPMVSGYSGGAGRSPLQESGSPTVEATAEPGSQPGSDSAGTGSSELAGRIGELPNQAQAPQQPSQSSPEQRGLFPPQTVAAPPGSEQIPATRLNPRQGPVVQGISPVTFQPVQSPDGPKKSKVGILAAFAVIGFLVVAAGAALVYFKYLRQPGSPSAVVSIGPSAHPEPPVGGPPRPGPNSAASPANEAPLSGEPGNAGAAAHFAEGHRHQEQGRMLAGSGSASQADEEYRRAIAEYNEAIKLLPVYPEAHENLGVALYDSGRFEDAIDEYKIAIDQYVAKKKSPTAQVLVNYGLVLFNSKRYHDAADAFGRALGTDPNDHDLYALRGFALQNAGDYEAAKSDYQRYLALERSGQYAGAVRQILEGRAEPPTRTGNR
jgi:serine/threonine-protein kinase